MAGIRIDALPTTVIPSSEHEFPAMKDGLSVKLSLQQVAQVMVALGLIDPSTAQTLSNKTISSLASALAIADGGTGQSTAPGAFGAIKQPASDTATGVVELATAAEVATGTDTARVPSVATMKNHQGVAKAWVNFNGTGTVAIRDSFNVTSITDNGSGDWSANLTTAMANANYSVGGIGGFEAVNFGTVMNYRRELSSASQVRVNTGYIDPSAASVKADLPVICIQVFGD